MYQSTVGEKNELLNNQRVSRALWQATRPAIKGATMPESWKLTLSFVRGLFKSGGFYSMPKDMFDRVAAQGDPAYQGDPSIDMFAAIQNVSIDFDFEAAENVYF